MIGGSVPSGRSARIVLTLSRTSCVPTSPFFESRNCTVTIETPSWVVDRSSSMPETVLMMSSIGLVTEVSISSTLAPGSTVVTVQTGKSTLGNRSTPSSLYETSPSTTGIATSTQVKTGRLMQMSEMVIVVLGERSAWAVRCRRSWRAVGMGRPVVRLVAGGECRLGRSMHHGSEPRAPRKRGG